MSSNFSREIHTRVFLLFLLSFTCTDIAKTLFCHNMRRFFNDFIFICGFSCKITSKNDKLYSNHQSHSSVLVFNKSNFSTLKRETKVLKRHQRFKCKLSKFTQSIIRKILSFRVCSVILFNQDKLYIN